MITLPYDGLDDKVSDGLPDSVCVHSHLSPHVPPESQQSPLVTLTDLLVSVRSELTVALVDTEPHTHTHRVCTFCHLNSGSQSNA